MEARNPQNKSSRTTNVDRRQDLTDDIPSPTAVELATELTIAWLGNPNTRASSDEVPAFLQKMHEAVLSLGNGSGEPSSDVPATEITPATTVRRSLASRDHILSLIDGKPYKMLRRHLGQHGLTPQQYRERYKLKADYPMTAPNYSEARRAMAQKIGLGRKPRGQSTETGQQEARAKAPARRGRKPKVAAAGIATAVSAPKRRGRQPKTQPAVVSTE